MTGPIELNEDMTSEQVADLVMEKVEGYYPEFIKEAELLDNLTTKVGFYGAMMEAISESPIPYADAQNIIMSRLEEKFTASMNGLRQVVRNSLAEDMSKN